ncbi:PREDICTED: C-type lectin domain family 2 member D-like [Gekko japonicus]|uniref:C-type lectin domain family 2 member D-like n=1 Tax=Gekko japonicus TaxID=146911 RepID=A0ABM1KZ19_GEKJA|nr:PREDICTED: C-type lectin domain family 2 member D-like [Gekko japonicus]XP_015278957.1 PREDICTED: C-type lectin domain family 2 member D-like [Gekko japonicus]
MDQGTKCQEPNKDEEFIRHLSCDKAKEGCQAFSRKHWRNGIALGAMIILIVVIGLATALGVTGSEPCSVVTYASCPNGWIGYLGICYYFSEDEADWLSSLRNCSSLGASLSTIETHWEMDFLLRYKGPIYHWIGLRKDQGKPWEWTDGRVFNNTLFDIIEGGYCAYLNDVAVMSSWCKTKKNWICSKPDANVQERKQVEKRDVKQGCVKDGFK